MLAPVAVQPRPRLTPGSRNGTPEPLQLAAVPTVSVVIPTLNEARNLPHVFALLPEDVYEVVLVDGNSTDDTIEVARRLRPDIRVVRQTRRGKGNALACGFAACRGDIIVMIDADGSTDPREIPAFVAALRNGADFAKGSRFTSGGGSTDITPVRRAGNHALNLLTNVLNRTSFTDLCYGYNAFWRRCLPTLDLMPGAPAAPDSTGLRWGDGFEIETIINVRVARAGLAVVEVPSFELPRVHGESNLNTVRDGLRVLRAIARERLRRPAPSGDRGPAMSSGGDRGPAMSSGGNRGPAMSPGGDRSREYTWERRRPIGTRLPVRAG